MRLAQSLRSVASIGKQHSLTFIFFHRLLCSGLNRILIITLETFITNKHISYETLNCDSLIGRDNNAVPSAESNQITLILSLCLCFGHTAGHTLT